MYVTSLLYFQIDHECKQSKEHHCWASIFTYHITKLNFIFLEQPRTDVLQVRSVHGELGAGVDSCGSDPATETSELWRGWWERQQEKHLKSLNLAGWDQPFRIPGGDEVRQMKRDDHLLDWVSHFSAKYPSWVNLQKLHVFSKDLTKRWNGHVRQKWSHWDWQLPSVWEGRRKYEEMYQNFSKFGLLMKHNVISLNISNHKTKRQCHLRLKHVSAPATRM